MNWINVLLAPAITTALIAALGFILKGWISTRLTESVGAEYKKAFERFKQQIAWEEKRKQQAAEVADLLAYFLRGSYDQDISPNAHRYELQKRYWALALWLDAPILRAVHAVFAVPRDPSRAVRKALIEVRRLYVETDDDIQAEELYEFSPVPVSANQQASTENKGLVEPEDDVIHLGHTPSAITSP